MDFRGCADKDDGIKIYKTNAGNDQLIKKLPVRKFDNNASNNKWQFIKTYWAQNCKLFEH